MARKKKEEAFVDASVEINSNSVTWNEDFVKRIEKLEKTLLPQEVKVRVDAGAKLPTQATTGSSGYDIYPTNKMPIWLDPNEWKIIPTGLYFSLPENMEIQVRPRSGWASKYAITVANSPGTLDQDYRGELKIILINHGNSRVQLDNTTKIAQIVFCKVEHPELQRVESLDETERGEGGFGSTGGMK